MNPKPRLDVKVASQHVNTILFALGNQLTGYTLAHEIFTIMPGSSQHAANRHMTRSSSSATWTAHQSAKNSMKAYAEGVTGPFSSAAFREATPSKSASLKRKSDLQASIRVPESLQKHVHTSTKPGEKQSIPKSRSPKTQNVMAGFTALQTDDAGSPPKKPKSRPSTGEKKQEEKRLRLFRKKAPQSYLEKLARATSQRHVLWNSDVHQLSL